MSTSNHQHQHQPRSGRRQPFGFLHANTLSSANAKGSGAVGAIGGGDGAAAAHSSDPIKNESKQKFRGVLTSIVSRRLKIKTNEPSSRSRSSSCGEALEEPPAMKTRATTDEDSAVATTAAAVLPREDTEAGNLCHNDFAASDVAGIFRQSGSWNDEMEDMLDLKQANPILDDCRDCEEYTNINETERIDPSKSLAKELEEGASGEPILSHNRLKHGEDGFKIHIEK